jgi:hypothetical protein
LATDEPGREELTDDELTEVLLSALDETASEHAEQLRALYEMFAVDHAFNPGDLVTWKTGLRNKRLPDEGAPGVVLEVLDEPVYDQDEKPDSAYFRERLDIVVGVLDPAGDLLAFHFDSRRFEPFG